MNRNSVTMKSRRGLSLLLSICLTFSGFPATLARAQNASEGSGIRITMEAVHPDTGKPFLGQSFHSLKPGMEVRFLVKAFDAAGKEVTCTPSFTANQGGNVPTIKGFKDNNVMIMGDGAGFADVFARCKEFPDARPAQTQVVNNILTPAAGLNLADEAATPQAPANEAATPQAPADAAAATSSGGDAALGVLAGIAVVGATVALVSLMMPKKWCGSWRCTTSTTCCNVFGGGQCSGTKEFSSESECKGYLGPTFGKSCHEC